MLYGCKNVNQKDNPDFWAVQTDNTIEALHKKLIAQIKAKYPKVKISYGYLETCGDSTSENCLRAVCDIPEIVFPGGYKMTPDCALGEFHNNPRNYPLFKGMGFDPKTYQANRVFATYPIAVKMVLGKTCTLIKHKTYRDIIGYLKQGIAVQVLLKKPGHYIAAIGYDDEPDKIICIDSWPERTGSYLCFIDEKEFVGNLFQTFLLYES